MKLIYSLQSEWLKTKRSAASWLCLIGGFFIPLIYLLYFLIKHKSIISTGNDGSVWEMHFQMLLRNMKAFLLPMGVIMASSLITQMEYKNNTWKQLCTTPQSMTTIFIAKFMVIVLMTIKFFLFFTIGVLISGYVPCLIVNGELPKESLPYMYLIEENFKVFVLCLPIIAIQYLISLNFKNFLVPVGIGLVGLIGTMIGSSWEKIFISPYAFVFLDAISNPSNIHIYKVSLVHFVIITGISYWLFLTKKEKG